MQYLKLDNAELNRQSRISATQKDAIKSLVSSINEGYKVPIERRSETFQVGLDDDINKLNKALRLYGVQHIVAMGEKEDEFTAEEDIKDTEEDESLGKETQTETPQSVDYVSANGYYGGEVPLSDIDSNKWFYDPDNVQWVGYPKDKDYASCTDGEIVRVSRYSVPDWEVYVPLEYQRSKDYQAKTKPKVSVPTQVYGISRNRGKFTPRVGRSVGRILQ
jgi:hypothetical protein